MSTTPNAIIAGSKVRHSRRNDIGTVRNIKHPQYRWQSPVFEVRFPLNPTAPHFCIAEDLTLVEPVGERPALHVVAS